MAPNKKSSKRGATTVSEWQEHPDGRHFRYYLDENGMGIPDENGDPQVEWYDAQTPRGEWGAGEVNLANVENYESEEYTHLSAGLQRLAIPDGVQVGTGSSSKVNSSENKPSRKDDKKHSSSNPRKEPMVSSATKDKGKGKEKETRHRNDRDDRTPKHQAAPTGGTGGASGESQPHDPLYGYEGDESTDLETQFHTASRDPGGAFQGQTGVQNQVDWPEEIGNPDVPIDNGGFGPEVEDFEDDESQEDDEFRAAVALSQQQAFGHSYPPGFDLAEGSHNRNSSTDYDNYDPVGEEGGDGSATPTPLNKLDICGTPGEFEALDNRYKMEPSHKFQPGEVFKVLWSEPMGQKWNKSHKKPSDEYTDLVKVDRHYVGFRRFIVVAQDHGHSTCVPILTYMEQGCKKKGVKPAKHGIVHTVDKKPKALQGEPKLGFRPVRMHVHERGEKLQPESRVNYSKLVTVEHNVKVLFIGSIHTADFNNIVQDAIDKCWADKIRESTKKVGDKSRS